MHPQVPEEIVESDMLGSIFKKLWQVNKLEQTLKDEQEMGQYEFQHKTNKELVLARM
jgi:hypothetical protein